MIITRNIKKVFIRKTGFMRKEKITALDRVNLKIKKGEIFGIIGPTGAGKTTLMKVLSTVLLPDKGTATINGYDVINDSEIVRSMLGVVVGEFTRALYWRLSSKQNLKFFASLKNMRNADTRIEELLELFDLKKWENELVMKYSTGMKHKLALAIALLNDPPILFLDEPLTGVDPITAHKIKKLIKEKMADKTIIWTSHNLYEIEEMCDRIALINKGKIVLEGSPRELKKNYWREEEITITFDNINAFADVKDIKINGKTLKIKTRNATKKLLEVMRIAEKEGLKVKEMEMERPSLREIFLRSVKKCAGK